VNQPAAVAKPWTLISVQGTAGAVFANSYFLLAPDTVLFYIRPPMASDSQDLQASVLRLIDQQDQLLKQVAELKKAEGKDTWDKLGALSGLLIALVGGYFSYLYSSQQSRQSQISENRQTQLNKVQTVGTFMPYLVGKDDAAKDIALSEVETLIDAETASLIAEHMNSAQTSSGNASGDQAAVRFLQRMANNGKTQASKDAANKALSRIRAAQERRQ